VVAALAPVEAGSAEHAPLPRHRVDVDAEGAKARQAGFAQAETRAAAGERAARQQPL
jgi:hypothetical protein